MQAFQFFPGVKPSKVDEKDHKHRSQQIVFRENVKILIGLLNSERIEQIYVRLKLSVIRGFLRAAFFLFFFVVH